MHCSARIESSLHVSLHMCAAYRALPQMEERLLCLADLQNKGSSGGHVMGLGVKLVLLSDLYVQIGRDDLSDTQAPA